jgi:hypothetical protein
VQAGESALADWIETIDRGVPRLVAAYKAYHDGVNEFLATPVFGGKPQQQSTGELESALDQFNAKKPALIQQGKDSGVAWTDSLVAAIGQGKIAVQDALKGNVSALDISKAAQEIGGKIGEGFVLYTADGVAKFRPALKDEVGFNQDVLAQGLRALQAYQGGLDRDTEAALARIKTLGDAIRGALGGLKAAADEARAWESIGQVGSPTGREALANAQRAANSAEGAKAASDAVKDAEKARKDAADAEQRAKDAAYASHTARAGRHGQPRTRPRRRASTTSKPTARST